MIDFANEGPFGGEREEEYGVHATIGVGGGGVNILDRLRLWNEEARNCYVIDTDEQAIRGSVVEEKFLLGKRRLRGLGSGGDEKLTSGLWAEQEVEIAEMLEGLDTAFVVCALGGGTGSGITPHLVSWLKDQGVGVIVFAVTPFEFEGEAKRVRAAESLKEIKEKADGLYVFSNQRCLHLPEAEKDIRWCLHEMNGDLAQAVESLERLYKEKGLSQVTWEDLAAMGNTADMETGTLETAWVGGSEGSGPDRLKQVVENAIQSVMMEDGSGWKYSQRAFAGLIGGRNFSMSEYQSLLRVLKSDLPDGFPLASGALVDPSMGDRLRLVLMLSGPSGNPEECYVDGLGELTNPAPSPETGGAPGKANSVEPEIESDPPITEDAASPDQLYADEEQPFPDIELFEMESAESNGSQKYFTEQEELPLGKQIHRGRFEKSAPTIYDGEDLDQPTFQRLGIQIRL